MIENKSRAVAMIKIILILIGGLWFINTREYSDEDYFKAVNKYKINPYNGRVLDKYIDKRYYKYIELMEYNKIRTTIVMNLEIGGLYNFIKIGDSLIKKNGEMHVRIIRENENLDTIYQMQFNNYTDD
jgi:hypothetical protein